MKKIFSRMNVGRAIVIGAVLFLATLPSFAADVTARIRGSVTDPRGAVLPNTPVTATNQSTGVISTTVTKGDGSYEFLSLPIGIYSISVQAPGFQSFKASDIKLDINTEYTEAVQLSVGSTSDTVNVSADAVQVDTTNIQLNNVVSAAQIVELPLIGRNFTQLEQLLPGVQSASDRFGAASVNGNQTQQSAFLINGTDTNDLPLNTITFVPSVDAISEFNLVTSSLNAEYSRNSGAIVSATIKNGTNSFHGDAFEFYRDTFLNNANFFQKTTKPGGGVPVFHQNIFGGTLGGPIWRDKIFFFGSYQGTRARQPAASSSNTVYTDVQRGGDFSSLAGSFSGNIVPLGISIPGCVSGADTYAVCLAKINNKIPVTAFNPISAALLKDVPAPNSADGTTFNFNPSTKVIQDQGIGRLDYSATTKDHLWFLYLRQHNPTVNDLPFTGATVPGFGDQSTREIQQYAFDYTRQFGASAVNDLSLHYNRFDFGAGVPQQVVQPASLGFSISPQDKSVSTVPSLAVGGDFTLGGTTNGPQPRLDQTYQAADSFSKVIGRHSLKFGYEGRRFNVTNPFLARNSGAYTFSDNNNVDGSGNALVDFLLGVPDTYAQGTGGLIVAYAFENYMFAQDQWKVSSNLTLTIGAGYQIDTPLHNRQYKAIGVTCFQPGAQSKIFPTAPAGLIYPGDTGCNDASGAVTHYNEIGPRIGFAYSPDLGFLSDGNSRKLSIRAGYGIYYNRSEEETALQNLGDPPFGLNSVGAADYGSGKPALGDPYFDLVSNSTAGPNKFPFTQPAAGAQIDFNQFGTLNLSQFGPKFRAPYSQNFNLTIQRELPGRIVATASYVGALGRHEQTVIEGNPETAAGQVACLNDPLNGTGNGCVDNRDSQSQLYPSHTQFGVANPALGTAPPSEKGLNQFQGNGLISSTGNSNYNAFQLSAKKDPTHGFLFQASYTYSHALDDASSFEGSGFGGTNGRGYNQFVPGLNYGNSAFDARHRFVFSPVYDIPGIAGSGGLREVAKFFTNGWEIAGISTFATGFPFDISYGGGVSNSLFCSAVTGFYACPDVPNQTGPLVALDPRKLTTPARFNHPGQSTIPGHHFFDTAAFTPEQIGGFGNESRNKYHGPGTDNTDMLLSKNFKVPGRESMSIQLRLETYNVFNHTNFNLPSGNTSGSQSFGTITTAAAGRQSQLGAKFYF